MKAGNKQYDAADMLPEEIPLFPLKGSLLLPQVQIPLNIFEPRYLEMVDMALAKDRVIGIIQPDYSLEEIDEATSPLCQIGCAGRIVGFEEEGDGRYLISLMGIARFRLLREVEYGAPYRVGQISAKPFEGDFSQGNGEDKVDRETLIGTLRAYLKANNLDADWRSISKASNESLVNSLSIMCPYGAAEKQALLEASSLKIRADTLVAITEIDLARRKNGNHTILQ